jgi:hypothetical protein
MTIDTSYDDEVIDIADLEALDRDIKIDSRTGMHNTGSERNATSFINSLPDNTKVDVLLHYDNGIMVKSLNEITSSYLIDELRNTGDSLGGYASSYNPGMGEGSIDFYQIVTHDRDSDGRYN